jgi:hypothetical protein
MTNESEKLFFLFLGESWKGDMPSSNNCHFDERSEEKSPPLGKFERECAPSIDCHFEGA